MSGKTSSDDSMSATIRRCPHCGNAFIPRRKDQRYCNATCRKIASKHRTMHNTQTQGTGAATSQDEPKPRAKTKPRSPRRKKEDLSPEAFEDMIDPVGSYEDMLRLTVRRLKKSLASETTSDQALPALARQLLAASRELDQYDGSYEDTTADAMLEGVEEDDTFRIEDI